MIYFDHYLYNVKASYSVGGRIEIFWKIFEDYQFYIQTAQSNHNGK